MIDVPIRVRDALTDGALLKNYRFNIFENFTLKAKITEAPYKYNVETDSIYYFLFESDDYDIFHPWEYTIYDSDGRVISTNPVPPPALGEEYPNMSVELEKGTSLVVDAPTMNIYVTTGNVYSEDPILTIDNDNLVRETVKIDERMCSGDTLTFGLCEGSSLEFQYFGIRNITGHRVQAFVDVQYVDTDYQKKWYTIPMGWYTVDKCSRQASTGIIKVTAYNKLKSQYLDASINAQIVDIVKEGEDGESTISLYKLLEKLLNGYSIETYNKTQAEIQGVYTYSAWVESARVYDEVSMEPTMWMNVKFGSLTLHVDSSSPDYYEYCIYEYSIALRNALKTLLESAYRHYVTTFQSQTTYIGAYADGRPGDFTIMKLEDAVDNLYALYWSVQRPLNANEILYGGVGGLEQYIMQFTGDYVDSDSHMPARVDAGFTIPYEISFDYSQGGTATVNEFKTYLQSIGGEQNLMKVLKLDVPEMAKIQINLTQAESLSQNNVTLRDIQTSIYESNCQYGKLDRVTDLFSGVSLNNSHLYPAETLYPNNSLYPQGDSESGHFSMYGKLWADEGNQRKFRYLYITYKGTETDPGTGNVSEVEKIFKKTIDANGTDDYSCSNNWLFKNMVWTDEAIEDYADSMAEKLQDVTWFPFEMWCAGLPYIETGDEIEIRLGEKTYTSYVLRRSLNGIQNLQDDLINGTLDIF